MYRLAASLALLVLLLFAHVGDHVLRQDVTVALELTGLGLMGQLVTMVALGLALIAHPHAPLVALATGAATTVGFVAVHVLPRWGILSLPYAEYDPGALSWTLMLAPAVAGVWVAIEGLRLERPSLTSGAGRDSSVGRAHD